MGSEMCIRDSDYTEVFSPVSRYTTVRLLLSLSKKFKWKRALIDIKNAFPNANLTEDIYVEQPEGCVKDGNEHKVYKLNKALYGLKQASREWFKHLHTFLIQLGCKQGEADPTMYKWQEGSDFVILVTYVDDILMFASSSKAMETMINHFTDVFEIRRSSRLERFLGFTIEESADEVKIHNAPMIDRLLTYFNIEQCKPSPTPLTSGLELYNDNSPKLNDETCSAMDLGVIYLFS